MNAKLNHAEGEAAAEIIPGQEIAVPHTAGTARPETAAPLGATDCHHHIADPRFLKADGSVPLPATVADYRLLQRRLGLSRSIVIAASSYGNDNSVVIDALRQIGTDSARGVAIVAPQASDAELAELHAEGVRGIRLYLGKGRIPSAEELKSLGARAAALGWNLQIVGDREQELVAEWEPVLVDLPCTVVIDHFGYAPQPGGSRSSTAAALHRMLDRGNIYVKLSAVYIQSKVGFPTYSDVDELATALVQHAPERLLWGTDWPHPLAKPVKPDDGLVFDQLARWAPSEETRRLILVCNPDRVYWSS